MPRFFAGRIPDDQWRDLLAYCLDHADAFVVHMPDSDGPLSHGRHEFRTLSGSTVSTWSGMAGAISISGELTAAARDLFWRTEISLRSYDSGEKLWDYRLLRGGDEILSVGDFADLLVFMTDDDLTYLTALGISTREWDALEPRRSGM